MTDRVIVRRSLLVEAASAINYYLEPESPNAHDYTWRELRHQQDWGLGVAGALEFLCVRAVWSGNSKFSATQWSAILHELAALIPDLKHME